MHPTNVSKSVTALEQCGWVSVSRRRRTASIYRLTVPTEVAESAPRPRTSAVAAAATQNTPTHDEALLSTNRTEFR